MSNLIQDMTSASHAIAAVFFLVSGALAYSVFKNSTK